MYVWVRVRTKKILFQLGAPSNSREFLFPGQKSDPRWRDGTLGQAWNGNPKEKEREREIEADRVGGEFRVTSSRV